MLAESDRNENQSSKVTTSGAESSTSPPTSATPNRDAFFDRLQSVEERCGAIGYMFIEGVEDDEDDDDEDDEGDASKKAGNSKKEYSVEQLSTVRMILITPRREKALKQAAHFVTCGQENDCVMMFNTHSGNVVVDGIPKELNKIMRKKTFPEKFDAFFALIFQLNAHDFWMFDNEMWGPGGELNGAIKRLGNTAKKLMARTDEELGIDIEFTRPGMIKLLENFQETLSSRNDLSLEEHFRWR